jgi:phage gpG-like protein
MAGGIKVQIDFDGLQKPRAGLAKLRDLGEDLTPFMEDATAIVLKSTINRFRTGRGPEGIPWPQTKRQVRQAVGSTGPNKARILDDTGGLLSSIQGETTSNSAEVGSKGIDVPGKLANQFGARGQTGVRRHYRLVRQAFGVELPEPVLGYVRAYPRIVNLPARPFIGIDSQDETDIDEAWQARIIRTFGNGR